MRAELLRLDAHRTSNAIKQQVQLSWLLSPNVIKPIQPTKTQAHTLSRCSLWYTHTHTHVHTSSPSPVKKATGFHSFLRASSLLHIMAMMCLPCMSLAQDVWHSHHSLLWYQWSAILQTSSKRTCQLGSYPVEPRAAASHDPQLSLVRLTYCEPWDDLLEQLEVFWSVCLLWMRHEFNNIKLLKRLLIMLLGVFGLSCPAFPDHLWLSGSP